MPGAHTLQLYYLNLPKTFDVKREKGKNSYIRLKNDLF